jgi:tungstate transport system permease protein
MGLIGEGLQKALDMMASGDPELFRITWLTLRVSLTAILISIILGLPLGVFLGLVRFPGRKLLVTVINLGMGLPPVVAGLWVTMLLWRSGPLGQYALLYTPTAMIMAQVLVSLPIIIGLTTSTFQNINPQLIMQIKSLGASRWQSFVVLLRESRLAIMAAIMAGLGRVLAEVGASMMVGGNIKGETRILTTAMVMEVSKGNFDVAIALSFILMGLAFLITFCLTYMQQRKRSS